ncbi:single-stranded DNA-binding protein [Spiroplasma litorale]|uniref:Single-stranded DNA-binding protein n=1 Tax=Spiroplasma litorale TaxID=216942 RepID=A0A0K1W264_9MOLU|nr:single-stranded DNA-binding protein [Spiroplasma litorale]AKX34420.1 single-stranded DNA-binding protein [Spiroplasma litorale]
MNNVTILGQLEGNPELVYNSKDGEKKLYKLIVKVPRITTNVNSKNKSDYINVKIWNNVLGDEYEYYDKLTIGLEGRLISYTNPTNKNYSNDFIAYKIFQLT